MRLSFNEVQVICHKAYFGLHRKNGEADKISTIVTNNEVIGLSGITDFIKTLEHLKTCNDLTIDLITTKNKIIVDLKDHSIVENISILLDQSMNIIHNYASATLQINNTKHHWLCIGALMELTKNITDINIVAKWYCHNKRVAIICTFQAGEVYPNVYVDNIDNISEKNFKNLTIFLSSKQYTNNFLSTIHTKKKFKQNHQKSINDGINVSEENFKIIQQFATAILVEETKESYKDAGE